MYNPCWECTSGYGKKYASICNHRCIYAKAIKQNEEMLSKIASAISNSDCNCPCSEGCHVTTDEACLERIMNWLIEVIR